MGMNEQAAAELSALLRAAQIERDNLSDDLETAIDRANEATDRAEAAEEERDNLRKALRALDEEITRLRPAAQQRDALYKAAVGMRRINHATTRKQVDAACEALDRAIANAKG